MSVQHDCILDPGPRRVRTTILGREVVGSVVNREFAAAYNGIVADILILDVDGSRYRVPATECDPA
jgi:hypothetical protein